MDSKRQKLVRKSPHALEWIARPYTHEGIARTLKTLKTNQWGRMEYQGVYKDLWAHLDPFIHEIANQISAGQTMSDTWKIGAVTHS